MLEPCIRIRVCCCVIFNLGKTWTRTVQDSELAMVCLALVCTWWKTAVPTIQSMMISATSFEGICKLMENFVGVSRAVTRNEAILDMWAKSDSDPSGDAYTIDLLSSSMLLLTPATMAVLYSLLSISVIAVVCVVAFMEPQGRTTALVDLSLLACAHVASIGAGLVVTFVLAFCVGANFGYWYRRDGMAVWLYIFPSLCVQLSFGRLLLFKRFYGVSAEFIQWRSSTAAVILLLLLTLLLAMAGLHMSLLFGMCALTRLAGFLLRIGIGFIAQRAKKESVANKSDAWPAWLGITSELTLASLGSIYLLDAMRFAVLNFTTSLGQEGAILPGDLTLALYVGLFGSSAILQSSGVQVPGLCAP